MGEPQAGPARTVDDVVAGLDAQDYLADRGLATMVLLAMGMPRPLLLEGEPGTGKTEVARALAAWTGGRLIRLSCYEGIDADQALYSWDYARQLVAVRAAEATGDATGTALEDLEDRLHSERFLIRRPLLDALACGEDPPPVLLIDEIDRADDEFEAFLLELLSDWSVTIPEFGTVRADVPPLTIITSNRTRDLHDALKRRCLYHWLEHTGYDREVEILRRRVPQAAGPLAGQVAALVEAFRAEHLAKPPGVAEAVDWATALSTLGVSTVDPEVADATLGAVLKYREDQDRMRAGLPVAVAAAVERAR